MENKSLKFWKFFAVVLMALNIFLIVFLLIKPPGRPPGPRDGNDPGKFIIEKLKFTGQQQTEFNKLREAHHDSIVILQTEGKKLRTNFFNGLTSDPVNSNPDSIANKIVENQKLIELATYNHFKEVKILCTPEQRLVFNDIIQDVIERLGRQQKERP